MARRSSSLAPTLALACLALTWSLPAAAERPNPAETRDALGATTGENDEKTAQARNHFQRGVQFYKDGDYKLALGEFQRAYELSQNYRILYNIGQVNHQLNNYSKAIHMLERYLELGAKEISDDRRASVEEDIQELRAKTASVEVVVNVPGAEIVVDDVPLGTAPLPQGLLLDPGDHHIEARKKGWQSAEKVVTLVARDAARVELVLEKQKPVVMVASRGSQDHKAKLPTPVWAAWIGTGALAVGAGVTGILATARANDLAALRDSPTSTGDERAAVRDQAKNLAFASDLLTGAAVVAGGTTLYFTIRHATKQRKPETKLGLGPRGVEVRGTF
jgi:tetratricopeptide (TPR) repeat protein